MLKNYLSLVKFSHTIFAMPFALIGFFLAVNTVEFSFVDGGWQILVFVILCMILARNAAMGFNRYIDRKIDEKNPRTAIREIPAGIINDKSALWFVIINSALFIAVTYFINELVFYLSPVALIVVLGYSLTKRFTWLCHFVLGVGLALAPIGAFLSVTGEFAISPLLFSFAVLFWTAGFDIIYALQDEEFDKAENLKSVPVLLGKNRSLILSTVLHVFTATFIILAGLSSPANFSLLYWIGVGFFIGLLIYQHIIVKPNDLSRVNLAFFTTNGIASLLFSIFTISGFYFL